MGIFGLTSYISQHKSEFFDDFKLYDCPVLIDGNSAASLVYSNLTRSNHAFGGDYDKYAHSTRDFVLLLRKCGLTPIFVFDGGYEQRKLKTVLERIKMNIIVCGQYKNKYRESKSFPLMLRDAFRSILRTLEVLVVQCDFEADNELVILGRMLNCPLISYDSDFCISDSRYIPFTTIDFKAVRFKKKSSQRKYYLPCKMFNVDAFLNRFGGSAVDKSVLPLLSCALGNDYIPPNTFKNFLQLNHLVKFEERTAKIVRWMSKISSVDQAVEQMVACVEKNRISIKKKIRVLLTDYNRSSTYLLKYIPEQFIQMALCRKITSLTIVDDQEKIGNMDKVTEYELNESDSETLLLEADEETNGYSYSEEDDVIVLDVEEYEISYTDDDGDDNADDNVDDNVEDDDVKDVGNVDQNINSSENESKLDDFDLSYTMGLSKNDFSNLHNNAAIINFSEDFSEADSMMDDLTMLNQTNAVPTLNDVSKHFACTGETALASQLPQWFLEKYRQGVISPNLINVFNFQRLFIPSQSEDYFSQPSHEICLPVLRIIIGIILGEESAISKVKCHARCKGMNLNVYEVVPVFEVCLKPLPTLAAVASISSKVRASILIDCLGVPANVNLGLFPEEWRLFVLILMYWKKHCKQPMVNGSHIRAVILCLIYLNVIDRKIGYSRSTADLKHKKRERKRSQKLLLSNKIENSLQMDENSLMTSEDSPLVDGDQSLDNGNPLHICGYSSKISEDPSLTNGDSSLTNKNPSPIFLTSGDLCLVDDDTPRIPINADCSVVNKDPPLVNRNSFEDAKNSFQVHENELFNDRSEYHSIDDYLDLFSEEDCHKSASSLLSYHQVSPSLLKNRKNFDLKVIHSFAQLQHCIQSISMLNSVLNFPFVQCQPHLCFSGTFLYNFYSEMNHRKLADGYITRTLLTKGGAIISLYRYLITSWEAITTTKVVRPKFEIKKRKKKKNEPPLSKTSDKDHESEHYHDPCNIYSMLPEE